MNFQARGLLFSFAIHGAAVLLIIVLSGSAAHFSRPMEIDFSIADSSAGGALKAEPVPQKRVSAPGRPVQPRPRPVAHPEPMPHAPLSEQSAAVTGTAEQGQAPVAQPFSASPLAQRSSVREAGAASPVQGPGVSPEAMKQGYLKEHFAYIRDLVQKKLSYPAIARRMGWEGRVLLSFIVCTDGRAKEVAVKEGSGIDLLDRNAVAAVHGASPFPRPPVEAKLIIPISYKLN